MCVDRVDWVSNVRVIAAGTSNTKCSTTNYFFVPKRSKHLKVIKKCRSQMLSLLFWPNNPCEIVSPDEHIGLQTLKIAFNSCIRPKKMLPSAFFRAAAACQVITSSDTTPFFLSTPRKSIARKKKNIRNLILTHEKL